MDEITIEEIVWLVALHGRLSGNVLTQSAIDSADLVLHCYRSRQGPKDVTPKRAEHDGRGPG